MPVSSADYIEGAAKAFAVLEAFSAQRQKLNTSQAAERAGLSRAAARRHLLTLAELGYLEAGQGDDAGSYWLAPRVLRLSGAYLASARLPRLVQPALNRLAAQTQLIFSVAVPDWTAFQHSTPSAGAVVIVARSVHPAFDRITAMAHGLHLGAMPALHTTSTGRILLAQLSPARLRKWLSEQVPSDGLARFTANTITTRQGLQRAVQRAKQQDHAYAREENELGVHAVAIALRNASGQCVAALNCVASVDTVPEHQLVQQMLPLMRTEARALMALL